jgi:RNA polymerase sigma-70 factor (ECF subfamily)
MGSPETSHSLLDRARDRSDAVSWRKLVDLYAPLVRSWVRPNVRQAADADDVVQEVLAQLVGELQGFSHNGRAGAFRVWLRGITVNRLRVYWRSRAPACGGDIVERLSQLEDPMSLLSCSWDAAHDRHVAETILDSIRLEFSTPSWLAFEATVRDNRPTAEVAAELGLTANAVLIAKSRILKRLRQKAEGLIDSDMEAVGTT